MSMVSLFYLFKNNFQKAERDGEEGEERETGGEKKTELIRPSSS